MRYETFFCHIEKPLQAVDEMQHQLENPTPAFNDGSQLKFHRISQNGKTSSAPWQKISLSPAAQLVPSLPRPRYAFQILIPR